jgi:dihydroxyacetone kinase-like protein
MNRSLSLEDLKSIFAALERVMADNFQLLTDLDAVAGDGDLGITMTKGFAAANKAASGYAEKDAGKLLMLAGMSIAREAPSTLGTLLASGFMKGGKEVMGRDALGLDDTVRMMNAFINGIMERGKAQPGEKTIIDALLPARDALQSAGPEATLAEAWQAAAQAAEAGLEATRQMKAVHGRAAYRGENSVGVVDPGATVGMMLVKAFAEAAG